MKNVGWKGMFSALWVDHEFLWNNVHLFKQCTNFHFLNERLRLKTTCRDWAEGSSFALSPSVAEAFPTVFSHISLSPYSRQGPGTSSCQKAVRSNACHFQTKAFGSHCTALFLPWPAACYDRWQSYRMPEGCIFESPFRKEVLCRVTGSVLHCGWLRNKPLCVKSLTFKGSSVTTT